MSGLTPPDLRTMVRKALDRIDRLERRLANLAGLRVVVDVPFTLVDVFVSTSPGYYFADPGGTIFEVVASLGTAGSSTTVISVTRNGNEIASITFGAGETFKKVRVTSDVVGNQDRLEVSVTTAGLGALDLTVQVRAKVAA